jgi:pantetheine-phosphate adenylyltransferase
MKKRFKTVAVGGTFDEFHKGHRVLLETAFEVGKKVIIGLVTDDFAQMMKKPHEIAPFAVRLEELKAFLRRHNWLDQGEIVPLYDLYGPAANSTSIEAIVVSQETLPGAHRINKKRQINSLPALKIITINMVLAENRNPISTTGIRRLEMDREGHLIQQ